MPVDSRHGFTRPDYDETTSTAQPSQSTESTQSSQPPHDWQPPAQGDGFGGPGGPGGPPNWAGQGCADRGLNHEAEMHWGGEHGGWGGHIPFDHQSSGDQSGSLTTATQALPSSDGTGSSDSTGSTGSTASVPSGGSGSIQQMLADLNASRAAEGKPPVTLDPALSQLAQAHSDDMQSKNSMFHNSLADILATGSSGAAQNVTGPGFSADSANAAFYNEKNNPGGEQGHYQNMIGNYTKVGIGVSADGRWTIDFGS